MTIVGHVFILFYAVLYGVIFAISDRWRPFIIHHSTKEGWRRLLLSFFFIGIFPIAYFIFALPCLLMVSKADVLYLALTVYCVTPLVAFYFLWIWIVFRKPSTFYTKQEQDTDPLKSELLRATEVPISTIIFAFQIVFFILGPIFCLVLLKYIGK